MRHLLRPLDRYVLREFTKIFLSTALGFPFLLIVIDLTEKLDRYLGDAIPPANIALSYLYFLPASMWMALPAAVLFATVFSIGGFTRYSEVTAAKASGISFHRLVLPVFVGAALAAALDYGVIRLAPKASERRADLLSTEIRRAADSRVNFTYAAEHGRIYKIGSLSADSAVLGRVQMERRGTDPTFPTVVTTVEHGRFRKARGDWTFFHGRMHVIPDSMTSHAIAFDSIVDRQFRERPSDLLAKPRDPQEMTYDELGRFITALERSGGNANALRVERMLKLAIPVTCFIIALFGAPLATSTQRGGTAYGIGVSLGTTVIFLMLVQLTKAVGGNGVIQPEVAAWMPNAIFGLTGLILLRRVRT